MKQIHHQEKEQFRSLFAQQHVEDLESRVKVLETFLQTEHHVTVGELVALLQANGHDLPPEFVLETLKLLCQFGFARKNRFDDGQVRYEHCHLGQHHDHMICLRCRNIFEFQDDALEARQVAIAQRHGFHMLQHKMEIYGLCAECLSRRDAALPLAQTKSGERVIIQEVTGGPGARLRLLTMGLRVGDTLEVITNVQKGQIAVAADQKRFVLGRGLAQKIMVKPLVHPKLTEEIRHDATPS